MTNIFKHVRIKLSFFWERLLPFPLKNIAQGDDKTASFSKFTKIKKNIALSLYKGRSLYFKLLMYFLLFLIPIIVIGLTTYINSANMVKEDFQEKITLNLEAASNTIDLYIKSAQETGASFFNDEFVQTYLVPRSKQTPLIKSGLWRIPKIIQRSENIVGGFADSIFAFVDEHVVYVGAGLNEFDTFFNSFYSYRDYDVDYWKSKLVSSDFIELLAKTDVYHKNMDTVKTVVPIVLHNRAGIHEFVMVINIDISAIEETLRGNSVFNSTAFVVVNDKNQIIYDSDGLYNHLHFMTDKSKDGYESRNGEIQLNGDSYIYSEIKSELYGWRYYAITPSEELSNLTRGILQMTVTLCVVFIIIGIFLSFLFSSSIYSPIKNIKDTIVQKKELLQIADGERILMNELDMIRSFIRSLVDNQLQYKEKYGIYTNEYIEYSLLLLLKGHKLEDKDILEKTLMEEFDFSKNGYICCSILFDFKEYFYSEIQDTERLYVFDGIKKVLQEVLRDYVPVYIMEYSKNIYLCVACVESEENEIINKGFNHILSLFSHDEEYCSISVGVGRYFTDLNDLRISFNESMTAINKRDKDKAFQIIHAEDISMSDKLVYTFYDEQKLLNCLKSGDISSTYSVVDEIFDKNIRIDASHDHIVRLTRELYKLGVRFMAERGQDIRTLGITSMDFDIEEKQQINVAIDNQELKENIKKFYHKVIELSGVQNNSRQGNLVSLITQYIDENYMKDLCLEQIADEMGVTAKYVSRVFRNNTGMLLTDYINEVRINKAKELLRDTNLKIQDIGTMVGIENRTTFLRAFKKVEGVSPTMYRDTLSKSNQE